MKKKALKLGKHTIEEYGKVFIIAEAGVNHNGRLDLALKLVDMAKKIGADAIKFQTFKPENVVTAEGKMAAYQKKNLGKNISQLEMVKRLVLPYEFHKAIIARCRKRKIIFFSTPHGGRESVDFLESLMVPLYKISSADLTNYILLDYIAKIKKPMIISIGLAYLSEINDVLTICKKIGNRKIALLKCTSAYPAPLKEMDLLTIPDMYKKFDAVVGLSDHSLTITASVAAVALGAKIIEKHFILDRKLGGPDAAFSMEPKEFKSMVQSIREVEKALGKVSYTLSKKVRPNRELVRSLFIVKDMKKGDIISEENIRSIRPNFGLHPKYFKKILGKRIKNDVERGTPLRKSMVV